MNKQDLLTFMILEFENANKQAMVGSGMSEQEADTKNQEYRLSISMLLAQVVDKMFEKNIL
jgi:hypothetical protein